MYELRPLEIEHLIDLVPQDAQQNEHDMMLSFVEQLSARPMEGWTGFKYGVAMGAAWWSEAWPGRMQIGMYLGKPLTSRDMVWAYRSMLWGLEPIKSRRIEFTVTPCFKAGHRLAEMLGFKREGLMTAYDPLGNDAVLYARIQ